MEMSMDAVARRLAVLNRHLPAPEENTFLETEDVCGIVAFVSKKEPCINYLIEGLTILQNRGYDSAGIASIGENKLTTTKFASLGTTSDAIDRLKKAASAHNQNAVGIAHTRWATHGGKTDRNAHPHHDMKDRVALVHNGVIQNANELRNEMKKAGVEFRSETDTEVIVQLIGRCLDEGLQFLDAVKKATTRLEGTWGICVIHKDHPDTIIAARNGSPLLIGVGKDGRMFVASEASAFAQYTKEFIALENGEIAVIKPDEHSLDLSRVEIAVTEAVNLTPEPWPHWTIKEIMEQPEALARALNYGGRISSNTKVKLGGLDDNKVALLTIQHLVLSACGTSWHACLYGSSLMRWMNCFETVQVYDSAEVTRESLPKKGGGFACLSQSGETKDVTRALALAQELGLPCFSLINAVGSLIARSTKCGVYLNAGREMGVASTKAFTSQVIVLSLVAVWFAQMREIEEAKRKVLLECVHRVPTNIGMTINRARPKCAAIADKIQKKEHMFVLGKGLGESVAREGALKIKEITYLHAEGYPGGALKHGPFALIEEGTPIILLVLDDRDLHMMVTACEEVKGRGAHVICITDKPSAIKEVAHDIIRIPSNGPLTALTAVVPLQLLAYELAVRRGIDPDKPRNLAKAVTVD